MSAVLREKLDTMVEAVEREFGSGGVDYARALADGGVEVGFMRARAHDIVEIDADGYLSVVGRTSDIAYCVLYLASDASSFVTGQLLSPNGGVAMHY